MVPEAQIKVFVGTLYSGENEFAESRASVVAQTYEGVTHEIIEYLPNKEAHDTLYARFMSLQDEYDVFIKLDADMVFRDHRSVEKIVSFFRKHPKLDHLILTVHDYYTDTSLFGIHCYSNRCRWKPSGEELFVDPFPQIGGERIKLSAAKPDSNLVNHAFGQTEKSAYAFGYHKVSKVVQQGRYSTNYKMLSSHWRNIELLVRAYLASRDPIRLVAISGAYNSIREVIRGESVVCHDRYKEIEAVAPETSGGLDRFVSSRLYRSILMFRLIGAKRFVRLQVKTVRWFFANALGKTAEDAVLPAPESMLVD